MRTKWPAKREVCTNVGKGILCECGHYDEFTGYVYAHWRDSLIYTCQICGRKYSVIMGTQKLIHTPLAVPGGKNKL